MKIISFKIIAAACSAFLCLSACAQQNLQSQDTQAGWLELPRIETSDQNNVHTVVMTVDGETQRNYTFLWNENHMTADWVAYPLCRGNMGSGKRSNAFGTCPLLPENRQPLLIKGYRRGNGGWYSRGHQIPSGDRLSYKANVQTFYGVNMTPQNEELNGGVWGSLENKVRSLARKCDTIYVVTGCLYEAYDGEYVLDNADRKVAVPTGYFKALLMRKGDDFHACAYCFENRPYADGKLDRNMATSVAELEERLGMKLFPNLEILIGKSRYNAVVNENPADQRCWGYY